MLEQHALYILSQTLKEDQGMGPIIHIYQGDAPACAVHGYLKAVHKLESVKVEPNEDGTYPIPQEGVLLISDEGQKLLPNTQLPTSLHIVYMDGWRKLVPAGNAVAKIVTDKQPVEETRKQLPWHIRHNGLSFHEAFSDRVRNRKPISV